MLREFARRLLMLVRRRQFDTDLEEEMRLHRELREQEQIERGLSPKEARYAAQRRFGNELTLREESREMWGWNWLESLVQDVRYGLRMLVKNPGFTVVAVLTLALGVGANTAIFSVVNAVLLRPLPYPDPDRLAVIWENISNYPGAVCPVTGPDFQDWQVRNLSFEGMAAILMSSKTMTGAGEPVQLRGEEVSPGVFGVLGVQPLLGRTFAPDEGAGGHSKAVILSYASWRDILGGARDIVGLKIVLNGETHEVVGVMPPSLRFPIAYGGEPEYFAPIDQSTQLWKNRYSHSFRVLARLKKGVPLSKAAAEMETLSHQIAQQNPRANSGVTAKVGSLHEQLTGDVRPTLLVLLAAVGFLLLIACANVANLLLTKSIVRGHENTIRTVLGSGLIRIVRQWITESVLLFWVGGATGLLVGYWAVRLLVSAAPASALPRGFAIHFDTRVFVFAFAVAFVTGILAGLAPAFQASSLNFQETLKEGSRTFTRSPQYSQRLLITCEVGMAMVMLIGAGLAVKSLVRLLGVQLGFDPQHVLTARVQLPAARYPKEYQQAAFYTNLIERVRALPGAVSAAAASDLPLGGGNNGPLYIEGQPVPKDAWSGPPVRSCEVTPGYFKTLGIPLLNGRDFTLADTSDSPKVAIISEGMARRFWPATVAVGRRFKHSWESKEWVTVIGVAGDVREYGLQSPGMPQAYFPETQETSASLALVVRAADDPSAQIAAIRSAVHSLDNDLPLNSPRPLSELVSQSSANKRFFALLLSLFAVTALSVASIGIYGVVAHNVAQRTHEIGIRIAVGAKRGHVLRLVVGQAFKVTLTGVGLGALSALVLTRYLKSLLYDVKPMDPVTFASVAAMLLLVALLASYIPARKATKIDPMVALRYE
jgi:putative ABC transport system permease protein